MRIVFKLVSIFLGFLSLFVLARVFFLWTNPEGLELHFTEWLDILRAAIPMDLSAVSMVFTILLLTIGLFSFFRGKTDPKHDMVSRERIVFLALGVAVIVLCTLDLRMFRYWGFHIDREFFSYLIAPKEALASVSLNDVVVFGVLALVQLLLLLVLGRILFGKGSGSERQIPRSAILISLPFLFLMARGGIGPATMNQATVYHSPKPFNNLAAINPVWNLVYSYTIDPLDPERYRFMDDSEAVELLAARLHSDSSSIADSLLDRGACRNLILIVLESFTAQAITSISGFDVPCTPCFDKAAGDGILFTQHYSTGDRSAESLVTLFTGFPAFTRVDVLDDPKRLRHLPHLYREFGVKGYETLFEYGGDLNFANMNALIREGRTGAIVDIDAFPSDYLKNQWGVHDAYVFHDFLERISDMASPFAATVFSLSSHEPYQVPHSDHFTGANSSFYNSLHYTDSCLGKLLEGIRNASYYDSTLVWITADHGNRQPGNWNLLHPNKFHTPLLLWGGPVKQNVRLDYPVSQAAIAPQIAELFGLNWPVQGSQLSLFDATTGAFYAYNDGGGMVSRLDRGVYDVAMHRCMEGNSSTCRKIQAYLQTVAQRMEELSISSDRKLQP
ncbi:MAG: sulfatase-like hydrolase/transferase [Flavobacteriales bacterium]|nr:sulfatase-like hydrolase/transferase [Flavobacteriales bacterium]